MKVAIYPGQFNPVHNSHIEIIKEAATQTDKLVLFVANGHNKKYKVSRKDRTSLLQKLIENLKLENVEVVEQKQGQLTPLYMIENDIFDIVRGLKNSPEIDKHEKTISLLYHDYNEQFNFHYFVSDSDINSTMIRKKITLGYDINNDVDESILEDIKKLWSH